MKTIARLIGMLILIALSAVAVSAQTASGTGDTILLHGQVLDVNSSPVANAVVELWQADINGKYNHPNSASGADLLADFQYFGTTTTDADGNYAFLTVKPAQYETRPPHIHFKVKIDGTTVLTSQFYFAEDVATAANDGVFAQLGNSADLVTLTTADMTDASGNTIRVADENIVVSLDGSTGTLTATPQQTEGPYYPVVDFSAEDNDLTQPGDQAGATIAALLDSTMTTASTPFTLFNLNIMTPDDILSIPGMPQRMVREFQEYRPYVSIQQFRREIGKYVGDAQTAEWEAYVYVPISVNDADAETLKQIPGVTEEVASALIAARPYADNDSFLAKLAELAPDVDAAYAVNYLAK